MIDITIVYILALICVSLVLLVIAVFVMYLKTASKSLTLKEQLLDLKEKGLVLSKKTTDEAQSTANKIIDDARLKAQKIISDAQFFSDNQKDLFSNELAKITKTQTEQYQKALNAVQEQSVKMLLNTSKDVTGVIDQELVKFRQDLTSRSEAIQNQANSSIASAYKKIEESLDVYKQERLKQLDEKILKVVKEVARVTISKTLSLDEHEKLVQKALEEAKKQNVL